MAPHRMRQLLPLAAIAAVICMAQAGLALAAEPAPGLALAEDSGSLMAAIAKVVGALAVVVGLMLLVLAWIRRMGLGKLEGRPGSLIRVLDTRMIAPKKYVAVLQVSGERIVVGITDQQINFLTSLEAEAIREELPGNGGPPPQAPFIALLKTATGRLTRKNDRPEETNAS